MNLRDIITQGSWNTDRGIAYIFIGNHGGRICMINHLEDGLSEKEINAKAIAQVPKLLGLVDVLYQRLHAKYHNTPEDNIPIDELIEYNTCKELRKELL